MARSRWLCAFFLVLGLVFARPAFADITDSSATNAQEGDNSADATQGGASSSGDAVGGLVTGIVSSGATSVDAKNRSEDVDVESGEANGTNSGASFAGLATSEDDTEIAAGSDLDNVDATGDLFNLQDGDNSSSLTQAANASSGDAVGGAVIGAVVSAGGSADIVSDNTSEDVDVETGEGSATNESSEFVGLIANSDTIEIGPGATDITEIDGQEFANIQEGDNDSDTSQTSTGASGDGVGGQVIGVVSAGDASVDAKNSSTDVDLETGVADASSASADIVGLALNADDNDDIDVEARDIEDVDVDENLNLQDGDNSRDISQSSDASTGDAVGGQVAGVVTAAGGSADVVADNASEDVDVQTGAATASNDSNAVSGLVLSGEDTEIGSADIDGVFGNPEQANILEGDNDQTSDQTATASSGDGVGGQVLGVVSSGDASVDAKNRSNDIDLDTGEADATNESASFVGLDVTSDNDLEVSPSDITDINVNDSVNVQDGDNSQDVSQSADATTGDAVGGQVAGVVTSAGGSADVVADNASEDVDIHTGPSFADNESAALAGLGLADEDLEVGAGASDIEGIDSADRANIQEGDNDGSVDQTATASSGDGVGGQVLGVVSSGDASLDAKNRSTDVDLDTGEADASNQAAALTGLGLAEDDNFEVDASDITDVNLCCELNLQDGDNSQDISQSADASTGDAVGGQVAGIVTSAGGSADVVADNASEDVDAETGPATAGNDASGVAGLALGDEDTDVGLSDISNVGNDNSPDRTNIQEGSNDQAIDQTATASSGDGVGGQVLGVVSSGDVSLDAKNRSTDVDLDTGEGNAFNEAAGIAGLALTEGDGDFEVDANDINDIEVGDDLNLQDGDNSQDISQSSDASSGDAVGGQVAGIVTSAGGSADVVADNASEDVDVGTGNATADNETSAVSGLTLAENNVQVGASDINDVGNDTDPNQVNVQDGDNDQALDQTATASTGDGVGGQVLGVVSSGDTSLDAKNRSTDVDLGTGNADASNDSAALVGQALSEFSEVEVDASDVNDIEVRGDLNVQDGDNSQDVTQSADASSGDAVGGQVAGIVTSASGSADVVADNASEDVDVETGGATAANDASAVSGLVISNNNLEVGTTDVFDIGNDVQPDRANVQDGDNEQDVAQAATASTGDGVGGQVLGVVSSGDASLDAKNRSTDVDLESGNADATNSSAAFVGMAITEDGDVVVTDVNDISIEVGNVQDGDNEQNVDETADATSGDAVGGQVVGAVTSAGGSANAVLDNTSDDIDASSGAGEFSNDDCALVGQSFAPGELFVGCSVA